MEYLDAYLIRDTTEKDVSPSRFRFPICLPERFSDRDGEAEIAFVMIPPRWLGRPERLGKRLIRTKRRWPPRGQVWYEDRIRKALDIGKTAAAAPLPAPFWSFRFYQEQPFRENLVLLLPEPDAAQKGRLPSEQERWVGELLGEKIGRLNSLLLVSPVFSETAGSVPLTEKGSWLERVYQETGLPAAGAGRLPSHYRNKRPDSAVCIDACPCAGVPYRSLPEGTLYLDMTSEAEKERLLYAKRRDIRYESLRRYLDTYVRKRYNTNRCKKEEKDRRHLPSGAFKVMKRKGNEDGREKKYPYL